MNLPTKKDIELWKLKIFLASSSSFVKFKQTEWKNLYKILHNNLDIFDEQNIFSKQMLKNNFGILRNNKSKKRRVIKDSKFEKIKWKKEQLRVGKKLYNKLKKDIDLEKKLNLNKKNFFFKRKKSMDIFNLNKNKKDNLMSDPTCFLKNFNKYLNTEKIYFQSNKNFHSYLNNNILRQKKFYIYSRSFSNSKKNKIEIKNIISPSFKKMYYYLYIKYYIKNKEKKKKQILFPFHSKKKGKENLPNWKKIQKIDMKILDGEIYGIFKQKNKNYNINKLKTKLKLISRTSRSSMFKIRSSTKLLLKEFISNRRKSNVPRKPKNLKKSKFTDFSIKNSFTNKYDYSNKNNYLIKNTFKKKKNSSKNKKSSLKNYFSNRHNYLNKKYSSNKNFLNTISKRSKKSSFLIKKENIKEIFLIPRRKNIMNSYLSSAISLNQSLLSFKKKKKKKKKKLKEKENKLPGYGNYLDIKNSKNSFQFSGSAKLLPQISINVLESSYNCL